jgi:hypothetical protein
MNGGFGGRFVPALLGAAVGGIASTEMISATGLEARRERGRHQPTGHLTPKIVGTVVQLGGIAPGVLSVAWRRSFGAMTPRRCHPGYARRKNLRTKTLDPETGPRAGRLGGASALGGGRQAERLVTENRDGG